MSGITGKTGCAWWVIWWSQEGMADDPAPARRAYTRGEVRVHARRFLSRSKSRLLARKVGDAGLGEGYGQGELKEIKTVRLSFVGVTRQNYGT